MALRPRLLTVGPSDLTDLINGDSYHVWKNVGGVVIMSAYTSPYDHYHSGRLS